MAPSVTAGGADQTIVKPGYAHTNGRVDQYRFEREPQQKEEEQSYAQGWAKLL